MRNLLTIVAATGLLLLTAPDAIAQKKADKVVGKGAAKAEQMRDRAEKRPGKDVMDEDAAEEARERAEDMREEAEERAEEARERAEESADEAGMQGQDNAATRGSEKSQEMRARRDERKQIQEEYREGRESGVDAIDGDDALAGDDSAPKKKEKKPWWKFWGD